jgi:hypothetical protein
MIAAYGPATSYEIKKWADDSVGYFWPFSRSQLYAEPRRPLPPFVLALLWHVSAELAARVDAFRAEVRRERLAAGMAPEGVDAAEAEFERHRQAQAEYVERHRREALGLFGPAVLFRLGPEVSRAEARAFWDALRETGVRMETGWLMSPEPEGAPGGVRLPYGASEAELALAAQWVRGHPTTRDVRTAPGLNGWATLDGDDGAPSRGAPAL